MYLGSIGQGLEVNFVVAHLHIGQAVNRCFLENQDSSMLWYFEPWRQYPDRRMAMYV